MASHRVDGALWRELTSQEMHSELESQTQRLLGISLEEFHQGLRAGTLPESPAVEYLRLVTGALPPATHPGA